MANRILLVDDDPDLIALGEHHLSETGFQVLTAKSGEEALERLENERVDLAVLDLMLPGASGEEILGQLQERLPSIPVVVLTARSDPEDVVRCMQLGALDYLTKPFDAARLVTSVRNALERGQLQVRVNRLVTELRDQRGLSRLLGESPAVEGVVNLLQRATGNDVTVLLLGESGTGKEVAARAIHAESSRRMEPFVAVNCGAIPETLIESQLFGHERGAFTGADSSHKGFFEQADRGTLFLDEVSELRLDLQVKLLRVLQERCVQRLGASSTRTVDVRVIAASNRDLRASAEAGSFRQDLYYRLAVFPVELPPLRARGSDVLLLAESFLARFAKRHGSSVSELSEQVRAALQAYAWPGNVRELENVIERAVLLEDSHAVGLQSLPDNVVEALSPVTEPAIEPACEVEEIEPLEAHERRILLNALQVTDWNVGLAAAKLGISRATLYRRIERFELRPDGQSSPSA